VAGGLSAAEVEAIARKGPVEGTREDLRRAWARMALLVLYFGPSNLLQPEASFAAISNRLFVGPVVETLVYSKVRRSRLHRLRCQHLGTWAPGHLGTRATPAPSPGPDPPLLRCSPLRRCRAQSRAGWTASAPTGPSPASSPATSPRPSRQAPQSSGAHSPLRTSCWVSAAELRLQPQQLKLRCAASHARPPAHCAAHPAPRRLPGPHLRPPPQPPSAPRRLTRTSRAPHTHHRPRAGEDAAAAAPAQEAAPRGFFAGLLGGLGGGKGGGKGGAPRLARPVVFPPEDLRTLVSLNDALLKTGAVKANAD
jgi:hypothetical protein